MCGLGAHRYQFEAAGVKTATEYTGERQDLVQHANRHMIVISAAIKTLCQVLLYIGKTFCNAPVDPDTEISVTCPDGFVIDEEAAAAKDIQLVQNGIMAPYEYRMKWLSETEEEAKAVIEGMRTATDNPFGFIQE